VTGGPQLGFGPVGIDGGYAITFADGASEHGPTGRLLVTLGLFSLYGRFTWLLDPELYRAQVGVQVKLPLWASE
jgi:hypothetical protein